jgi:hypothetical protein
VNILDMSILLSNYGRTVTASVPSIPTGLTATAGNSSVTLKWNANPSSDSVDAYQVYWTTDSAWATNSNNLDVTGTSYTVTGLTNGTTYYFRISAHNSAGYGAWGNPVSAVPTGTVSGIMHPANGLGLWHLGTALTGLSNLNSYGLVAVSAGGQPQAKPLPGLTLIYTNASSVVKTYTEGLSYSTASANGWLVGTPDGSRYVVNHTNSALNQAMVDADVSYAQQMGLKGVFLDDVIPQNPYGVTTPTGWEQGMVTFVHMLHQALNAKGMYLLTNANAYGDATLGNQDNGAGDLNWAKMIAPDGIMEEDWQETRNGSAQLRTSGSNWDQDWTTWLSAAQGIQAAGMDFVGLSYNTNIAYTYASLLLANSGRGVFIHATLDGSDPWNSLFTYNIGTPSGSVTQSGVGYWRKYTNGQVIVNPSPTSAVTINNHTLQPMTAYIGP